ncbi:TlpA disulfide reductase family protein [soil metagenome]
MKRYRTYLIAICLLIISNCLTAQDTTAWQHSVLIDTIAPAFSVVDVEGNKWDSETLRGKTVIINFWSIGCKGCIIELPQLNKFADSLSGDTNLVFLSFLLDGGQKAQEFLKTHPVSYHVIINTFAEYSKFQINCFPSHLIIDSKGYIRYNECDIMDKQRLNDVINKYR